MKIAVVQSYPKHGDVAANLTMMKSAITSNAQLYIFPELALSGYFFTERHEVGDLASEIDGRVAQQIATIAKQNVVGIITGFLERVGERFYNSALAFDYLGNLVGHYRKVHRFYYEKKIFEEGNLGFPVVELKLSENLSVKTGMMICYDWRFPEAARSLALRGAELIAVPSNIVTTTGMLLPTFQTRAFENKAYLAFADRIGSETQVVAGKVIRLDFQGMSSIIAPNGSIIATAGKETPEIVIAEIDPEKSRNKSINEFNDIFQDRAPEAYKLG